MRIDSQFEKVAKEHSTANAVFSPKEGYLSYKELDELSDEIADNLMLLPDSIIGVSIERSFSLIITILGIIKSNKAYLPIDFSYPEDRVSHMLSDSKVDSVICSRKTEGVFRSQNKKIILYDELLGIRSTKKKHSEKRDLDVAYVLYTSGSTGKPRGVVINHKSIMNTIKWRIEYYSLNGLDRVIQIPSISFDSSVEDIFCTLLSGGLLCLISEDDLYNVKYLSSLIIKEKITHFICVPSFYRLLLPEIPKQCSLRFVVLAGESLDTVLVRQHYSSLPNVSLYNEYGPSENSVCSTVYLCKAEDENVPIGKTISNVDYLILSDGADENYGELLLGGEGLSNGYINNIEYTREKFKTINGKRYYKTGDFVKLLPSGNLFFCGRQDQQIKKNGIRFDLSEIDRIMLEKEAVYSFSILIEDENHVLNTVTFTDGTVSFENAVETLSKYIPKQFIPDEIIQLNRFEYLPNGKLNVSFLKNAFLNSRKQFSHDIESHNKNGSIDSELLDIISFYTKQPIKATDFDLDLSQTGIDSINHIKVLVDIENRFEFEFEYEEMDILTHASLNTLIDVVKRKVN